MSDHTVQPAEAAGNGPGYVHLRVHSAYSLLEGALPLSTMIAMAVADAQPAIGIADTNNLFGALEFSVKAVDAGLQPILGCQLDIDMEDGGDAERRSSKEIMAGRPSLVLIAASASGYARLVNLVSRAYLTGTGHDTAHIYLSWLREDAEGLICLTGGLSGPVDAAVSDGHAKLARQRLETLKAIFADRLYVELQRPVTMMRAMKVEC